MAWKRSGLVAALRCQDGDPHARLQAIAASLDTHHVNPSAFARVAPKESQMIVLSQAGGYDKRRHSASSPRARLDRVGLSRDGPR